MVEERQRKGSQRAREDERKRARENVLLHCQRKERKLRNVLRNFKKFDIEKLRSDDTHEWYH